MGYTRFNRPVATCVALGFTLVAGVSWGASLFDPINVESMTSPAPNQPWAPDQSLPIVTAPNSAQYSKADLEQPLSLAELTDLALQLNPRTRQAWLTARGEAAALGIEKSDDWPQINGLYFHQI